MKSNIYYNSTSQQWIALSLRYPKKFLYTKNKMPFNIPVGTHTWVVGSHSSLCYLPEGEEVQLTFSNCFPMKYTCNNGDCIPLG